MYDEDTGIFDADAIPISDDQMRALARIPYSDTGKSILDTIDSFPLSFKLQTGMKQLALAYLSRDAIFAHNSDISSITRAYNISAITLDFLMSPKDAESNEIPPFMRNLLFLVQSRASRTIGGETKDERTLQYNPTQRVEQIQRVEHTPLPREPEADEGGL